MTTQEHYNACLSAFSEKKEILKQADERIELNRKGDFILRLTDRSGNPIANREIVLHQKSHDFKYGANLFMLDQFESDLKNSAFRSMFSQHFNLGTVPFYWDTLEPEQGKPRFRADSSKIYRRPATDLCVDFCEKNGILPKLHCLVYDKFIPGWLPKNDMDAMTALYEKRIREIAERYRGKMYEFEVINETLEEQWWQDRSVISTRRDVINWAFSLARKYLPGETLVINDGNFIPEIYEQDYRHPYFMQLELLIAQGVPCDKIGIQNHIYCGVDGNQDKELPIYCKFFDPERIVNSLDILSELGKPLEITEVTIPTLGEGVEEEEIQAQLLYNLYRLWFACPAMESVVYWNSVENTAYDVPGGKWKENNCKAGLFHRDLTPKKSGEMLYRLFHEIWHTDLKGITNQDGELTFRGFYGDYSAEICGKTLSFGLKKGGEKSAQLIII